MEHVRKLLTLVCFSLKSTSVVRRFIFHYRLYTSWLIHTTSRCLCMYRSTSVLWLQKVNIKHSKQSELEWSLHDVCTNLHTQNVLHWSNCSDLLNTSMRQLPCVTFEQAQPTKAPPSFLSSTCLPPLGNIHSVVLYRVSLKGQHINLP